MKLIILFILCSITLFTNSFVHGQISGLSRLNGLTGSWDVITENRLSANGPWETNRGQSVISRTTGETVLEENFSGILQKKPFLWKTLIAYNHFTEKFQRIYLDSEHGVLIDFEGEIKGDSVIFEKKWVYPNKSTVKLRVVYRLISPDVFQIENMRMPEGVSAWDITGRMRYTRIKN